MLPRSPFTHPSVSPISSLLLTRPHSRTLQANLKDGASAVWKVRSRFALDSARYLISRHPGIKKNYLERLLEKKHETSNTIVAELRMSPFLLLKP